MDAKIEREFERFMKKSDNPFKQVYSILDEVNVIINKFQNYYNVLLEDNNDRTADDYVQEYCIEASEDLTLALASSLSLNHSGDIEIAGELTDSIV